MQTERAIWTSLLSPALAAAAVSGGAAYWFPGGAAAAFVASAGCLVCYLCSGVTATRWARTAGAQLRRPQLRRAPTGRTGIYGGLVEEAGGLISQCESQAREATDRRTELEARMNVRRREVHRLRGTLDGIEQPVIVVDMNDKLLYSNPSARTLLAAVQDGGADPDAARGLERVPALLRLVEQTRTRNAATNHRSAELELEIGGETLAYRASARNVYDGDSSRTPLGVAVMLEDIRDERKEKARHAEFVSSVCHELKTPMAGIRAYTEMLIDGDVTDPDEQREVYGFIDLQVDRLTRLVNNMLNLTRIQSGVIEIKREDCGLNEVLAKAADVVEQLADEKQIRLQAQLSDLYLPVHVDKDLFGQAVINLLSNAVKYTPEGGEVRLRSRLDEERAVVEVRDTGMGIPEESLPHIFDRFYRVPQNNKAAAGTGLGLALVHYIVTELHNGSISVDSRIDEGTTFTASIPLGHVDQNRRKQVAPAAARGSPGNAPERADKSGDESHRNTEPALPDCAT